MLERLATRSATVGELAEPFSMSLAAVSKHLKVLERAGLITREVQGRVHRMDLRANPLADAQLWIASYQQFWRDQFDSLSR